jgi:NEDD4-binding protein 2
MNWYKKAQNDQKTLVIMRGFPGSGKSSLAKQLGQGGIVLGSDDFFVIDGKYQFDPNMLSDAHLWNQGRVLSAIKKGITPIVVDNTNVQKWEMKPYVEMAQKYGYQVELKEPNTPWKFDVDELTRRNTHNVPKEVIEKLMARYEKKPTIDDVLKSERPQSSPRN